MYIIVSAAMGVIFSIAEVLLFENKKNPLKDELYTDTAHYKKIVEQN